MDDKLDALWGVRLHRRGHEGARDWLQGNKAKEDQKIIDMYFRKMYYDYEKEIF